MRELPKRHRPLLEGRHIMVASVDRVLISGLVHSLDGIGSLVGTASTEANALCLIETKKMKPAQAQDIANRFLLSKRVSDTDRDEVETAPGQDVLMRNYIDEQRGCQNLVRKLR